MTHTADHTSLWTDSTAVGKLNFVLAAQEALDRRGLKEGRTIEGGNGGARYATAVMHNETSFLISPYLFPTSIVTRLRPYAWLRIGRASGSKPQCVNIGSVRQERLMGRGQWTNGTPGKTVFPSMETVISFDRLAMPS